MYGLQTCLVQSLQMNVVVIVTIKTMEVFSALRYLDVYIVYF